MVDRLRGRYDGDTLPPAERQQVADACDALWAARDEFAAGGGLDADTEARLRADLLDLALLSADLRARSAGPAAALGRLAEAERTLGPNPVLARVAAGYRGGGAGAGRPGCDRVGTVRGRPGEAERGRPGRRRRPAPPGGGRRPGRVLAELLRRGVCVPAGGTDNLLYAAARLTTCLTLARDRRGLCHYHRALVYAALGNATPALLDCEKALEYEPSLAAAALLRDRLRAN